MILFLKMEAGGLLSVRAHKVHCETLSTPPKKKKPRIERERKGRHGGRLQILRHRVTNFKTLWAKFFWMGLPRRAVNSRLRSLDFLGWSQKGL